jgi:hypothetical protein
MEHKLKILGISLLWNESSEEALVMKSSGFPDGKGL